jgi:uncharacterized protein YjiS (DUF1127 family)
MLHCTTTGTSFVPNRNLTGIFEGSKRMRLSHTIALSPGAPASAAALLSRLQSRLHAWRHGRALRRRYRRDASQLEHFNDRELWDLGLSRADIPAIARGTYQRD